MQIIDTRYGTRSYITHISSPFQPPRSCAKATLKRYFRRRQSHPFSIRWTSIIVGHRRHQPLGWRILQSFVVAAQRDAHRSSRVSLVCLLRQ